MQGMQKPEETKDETSQLNLPQSLKFYADRLLIVTYYNCIYNLLVSSRISCAYDGELCVLASIMRLCELGCLSFDIIYSSFTETEQ